MLRNQATALLRHEHLTTTVPRAKELRPFVERIITIAKRGVADGAENGKAPPMPVGSVMHDLQDREVVAKLFETLAPRFAGRPGGYTRLLRLGFRKGDAAEIAQVELVGGEFNPRAKAEAEAAKGEGEQPKKSKGVGGRLKAAAERLRGKKEEPDHDEKAPKRTSPKGASRKVTTPRKAGGS